MARVLFLCWQYRYISTRWVGYFCPRVQLYPLGRVLLYPGLPSFSFFLLKDKRKAAKANIEASGSGREAARVRNQLQGHKGKQESSYRVGKGKQQRFRMHPQVRKGKQQSPRMQLQGRKGSSKDLVCSYRVGREAPKA